MPKIPRRIARTSIVVFMIAIGLLLLVPVAVAQQYDTNLYSGLRWRLIGPFRGGRINVVSGVPGQPEEVYYRSVCGGVLETKKAGRAWEPRMEKHTSGLQSLAYFVFPLFL